MVELQPFAGGDLSRITASSLGRRRVCDLFGRLLLHLWPMEDLHVMRDLMRDLSLAANVDGPNEKSVVPIDPTATSLLFSDLGVFLRDGVVSYPVLDYRPSVGQSPGVATEWQVMEFPPGLWERMSLVKFAGGGSDTVDVYVAEANLNPETEVVNKAFVTKLAQGAFPDGSGRFDVAFPFNVVAEKGQVWAYVKLNGITELSTKTSSVDDAISKKWDSGSGVWLDNTIACGVVGAFGRTWPQYDKFTAGVLFNVDKTKGAGVILAIADSGADAKFQIELMANRTLRATTKDENGTTTLTLDSAIVSPGVNLAFLSYEKNVSARLFLNGVLQDSGTPADEGLFDRDDMTLCIGGVIGTAKVISEQLTDLIVGDVWMANSVFANDEEAWALYDSYITPMITTIWDRWSARPEGFPYKFPFAFE